MALLDLSNFSMEAEEAQNTSQAVFEKTIMEGDLSEHHDIVTGIEHKTQIPFIGNLGLLGYKQTGCSRTADGSSIPFSEKFWDPVLVGDRLKHCATDVPALLKLFSKAKKISPDFFDRLGSEEMGVVVSKVDNAMKSMLNRLVWFGDTSAENVTDSGVIKDGVDVKYFTPIDGLFKQIFTDVPTTASNYVAIAKNSGASYALQELAADTALGIFRAMYNKMDARFFQALEDGAQPILEVTRELFQNYQDQLEDKSLVFTLAEAKEGVNGLTYRGIPIKVRYDWDNNIKSYQDNGTKLNLPHRAILTVKENIPVGTLSTNDFNNLESWYEQKDKANYIDFDLKIDAKHLLDYMTVAAY
jgi:hypothetical protein